MVQRTRPPDAHMPKPNPARPAPEGGPTTTGGAATARPTGRPERSGGSQAGGCPRPAPEGQTIKYQRPCKPGSVPLVGAATIHLGCVSPRTSSNQPAHPGRIRPASRHDAPIRSCSRWGLPCRACCQPRGALLPHPFDLAFTPGGRKAVCFLWHCPWGHPRRALPATVDPWSPDFPRSLAGTRPPRPLAPLLLVRRRRKGQGCGAGYRRAPWQTNP